MRILYGVVGQGFGHATRSRPIIEHLSPSHEVLIAASAQAHTYLTRFFPDVIDIEGLRLAFDGPDVDPLATAWKNIARLPVMAARNFGRLLDVGDTFTPDVVISDFDSFSYMFAELHGIPVISIDNMHIMTRCRHDVPIPPGCEEDYWIAREFIEAKLRDCYHYMITTFFFPEVCEEDTSLYPPVLRPEVLGAAPGRGEHVLFYQTFPEDGLLEALRGVDAVFRVYGLNRHEDRGNLQLREFSEDGFLSDLASCRAVVATGGFSLMSEAVYLGKPYLAVPVGGQFEQILNALYLQELGYGEYHTALTADAIGEFLTRSDAYADNLRAHRQDGNADILAALDALLSELQPDSIS